MNVIRDDIGHFVRVSQIGEAGDGVHSTIFKIIMNPLLAIDQVVSALEKLDLGSFLAAVARFCARRSVEGVQLVRRGTSEVLGIQARPVRFGLPAHPAVDGSSAGDNSSSHLWCQRVRHHWS